MAIARSLAIAANEQKRIAAYQAYRAKRDAGKAIAEALQAFCAGISGAASTAMLQLEQSIAARRDDGLPMADDQLSAASRWDALASGARRRANEASGKAAHDGAGDGMHLDVASDDEADGASATYYHAMPGTTVVVDDDGNAERTTLHVIGGARISDPDDWGRVRTKVYVTLKRETERDGIPTLVHVDPSCIAHATLLSACERISRMAWQADRIESIPDQISVWCSVGRYAGASDSPGWAYTGWAWLSYNRAAELTRQDAIRGSKAKPLHRADISRVKRATVVASQHSEAERMTDDRATWFVGHDVSTVVAESAVKRVQRERKQAVKSGKVRILAVKSGKVRILAVKSGKVRILVG